MRIGLVTDIHDHVEPLRRALELFREHRVDLIVTLGDTCEAFTRHSRAGEVADLLHEAKAIGVWGNHDFSMCHDVEDRTRSRYPADALNYLSTMRPLLVIDDCHFSHVGPFVDAFDAQALWSFEEEPIHYVARAWKSFELVRQRLVLVGHHHRWLAITYDGILDWRGNGVLKLSPTKRYFLIVGACFQGQCGILDTVSGELTPMTCSSS